jgi:hypothetical protein
VQRCHRRGGGASTVARHGRDGISSEEGGNGAPMAKLDGFFVLRGWRDLGSSPGWVS